MEILDLLEQIEDVLENGINIPLSGGKCLIDRDTVLDLVQEMRLKLPDDLKMAKRITEEKQRYLKPSRRRRISLIMPKRGSPLW